MICRQNLVQSHVNGMASAFSQCLIYFVYAAVFTFSAFLIKKDIVTYENMFKYVTDFVMNLSPV